METGVHSPKYKSPLKNRLARHERKLVSKTLNTHTDQHLLCLGGFSSVFLLGTFVSFRKKKVLGTSFKIK